MWSMEWSVHISLSTWTSSPPRSPVSAKGLVQGVLPESTRTTNIWVPTMYTETRWIFLQQHSRPGPNLFKNVQWLPLTSQWSPGRWAWHSKPCESRLHLVVFAPPEPCTLGTPITYLSSEHFMMFHPGVSPSHHNPPNFQSWGWQPHSHPTLTLFLCLVLLYHLTLPWASSSDIMLRNSYAPSNPQNNHDPGLAYWVYFDK